MNLHLGDLQVTGCIIYVFDPCVEDCPEDTFPGSLDGDRLTVTDVDRAVGLLIEASNSADYDHDNDVRDALTRLAFRVRKAASLMTSGPGA